MLLGVSRLESTSWMLPRWFVPRALNPPVQNSGPWEISEGQSVESLKTSGEANMGNGEANMGNGEANMGFNPLYGNLRFHDGFMIDSINANNELMMIDTCETS